MLNRYYQEELLKLRKLAKEFAQIHPALAPYLSGPSADPDVERLLEGVAFIAGMLRQKLDDDFPEIIHELMELVWPHYLRPVPCSSILSFSPKPGLKQVLSVPAGTQVSSLPVDGTSCIFTTVRDVDVHPAKIKAIRYVERAGLPTELSLKIELEGLHLSEWQVSSLELCLGGAYADACDLYFLLCTQVFEVKIHGGDGGEDLILPSSSIVPGGFEDSDALFPYPGNAFPAYRLLQEYFINPRKFLFISLNGLERWRNRGEGNVLEISFRLKSDYDSLPDLTDESFLLSAVPIINLFSFQAEPIRLDHRHYKYPVRPASNNSSHYQVYSVEKVRGLIHGTATERHYKPFEMFGSVRGEDGPFFNVSKQPSISDMGIDYYISLAYPDKEQIAALETLSIDLQCTNGFLPEQLGLGDICRPTSTTPELVEFQNVTSVSPCSLPTLGKDLLWRFISHLNLNYSSLLNAENFKALLKLYVFSETRNKKQLAVNMRRIEGIEKLNTVTSDRLISGLVFRGQDVTLQVRQDHFASNGDMYLFGSVVEHFLGCYAAINSFVKFTLQESFTGEQFQWSPRIGYKKLL